MRYQISPNIRKCMAILTAVALAAIVLSLGGQRAEGGFTEKTTVREAGCRHPVWSQTSGPEGGQVNVVVSDPIRPDRMYAGAYGHLFKTSDGGGSWVELQPNLKNGATISCVAIDTQRKGHSIYAGLQGYYAELNGGTGVIKSTDEGRTWTMVNQGLTNMSVSSLVIDPVASQVIYAGTRGAGVYRSTDGGSNWSPVNNGLTDPMVWTLAIDPESQAVYAGTSSYVFRSTDGGASWSLISNGMVGYVGGIYSLTVIPGNGRVIYAVTGAYLFRSSDGGDSWVMVDNSHGVTMLVSDHSGQTLYASNMSEIFRFSAAGGSWSSLSRNGLPKSDPVIVLLADPTKKNAVIIGTGSGVYKSRSGFSGWQSANRGLVATGIYSMTVNAGKGAVYAGASLGLFLTTDVGRSWDQLDTLPPYIVSYALAIDPGNQRTMYAGMGGIPCVFKSRDSGRTWQAAGVGFPSDFSEVFALAIDPSDSKTVYAGSYPNGVYKSTNAGASWKRANNGIPDRTQVQTLVIDPVDRETVYAGTSAGMFISTNAGGSWTAANSGLPDGAIVMSLAIDPRRPQFIYAGTNSGAFKSTNCGHFWSPINTGLPAERSVNSLVVDPANTQTVYLATNVSGIFRSDNGGGTWREFNDGLAEKTVWSLAIDPVRGVVYAGTAGKGVFWTTGR